MAQTSSGSRVTKELTPKIVRSLEVGGSTLPSVFVAKSSGGGCAGGGIAGRAGAVLAAGAVAVVDGASAAMAARECNKNVGKGKKGDEGPEQK